MIYFLYIWNNIRKKYSDMIFSEDNKVDTIETYNPDWDRINRSLNLIEPFNKSFFILKNDLGSYIQCAGSKDRLTIEFREYDSEIAFKHFIVGKGEDVSPLNTVWTQIDCRVGPIRIHNSEVLTIKDAVVIFKAFFNNEILPLSYKKRNVTKQYRV